MEQNQQANVPEQATHDHHLEHRISSLVWASILVWSGLIFLAGNLGLLSRFAKGFTTVFPGLPTAFSFLEAWPLVFLGAGVIFLFSGLIRLFIPAVSNRVGGAIILGMVFIGISLGQLFSWNVIGPIVLVAIGVVLLLRSIRR
jgi:hypothetical protein